MSSDVTVLSTLGTLSVVYLFYILAKLSQRLGAVEKMAPYYRYFYVANTFIIIGSISHMIMARVALSPQDFPSWLLAPWFLLLGYYGPLTIGVTIGIVVTWRYWSWLIREYVR